MIAANKIVIIIVTTFAKLSKEVLYVIREKLKCQNDYFNVSF